MHDGFYTFQRPDRSGHYIEINLDGQRVVLKAGKTEQEAEHKALMAAAFREQGATLDQIVGNVFPRKERPLHLLNFREVARLYLADAEGQLRDSTFRKRRLMVTALCKEPWARLALRDVKPSHLNRWAGSQYEKGLTPCAVNRKLSAIRTTFKFAIQHGMCTVNPATADVVPRRSEKAQERDTWWTRDEIHYLLDVCREVARPFSDFFTLAIHTGARRGELRQLQWLHADLGARTLMIPASIAKNKRARTFRLSQGAFDVIAGLNPFQAAQGPTGLILRRPDGRPWTDQAVGYWWQRIRKAAKDLPAHKSGKELRLHSARHTFVTLLLNEGVPLHVVGRMAGHSSVYMVGRYGHLTTEAQDSAVGILDSALAKKCPKANETAQSV